MDASEQTQHCQHAWEGVCEYWAEDAVAATAAAALQSSPACSPLKDPGQALGWDILSRRCLLNIIKVGARAEHEEAAAK